MTVNIKKEYQDQLNKMYPSDDFSIKQISNIMGISPHTVAIYARRLGLNRPKSEAWNKLSDNEEKLILDNYEYGDLDALAKNIGKSKHAISEWARRRGLVRKINVVRNGDLEQLLNGSLEAYYWHGALAADGYISKDGHLMLSQGEKDKAMVYAFAKFIRSKVYEFETNSGYKTENRKVFRVNVCDRKVGPKIREIWGLRNIDQKTYAGINLDFLDTKEKAIAFFVGMFDGDGSLLKTGSGRIEVHANWVSTLVHLNTKINCSSPVKINKRGYAVVVFSKKFLRNIRSFIVKHNLPHNSRKWNN